MIAPFSPTFYRSLQQLKIHSRRAALGSRQGSHRSTRRGHGLEFADYRLYTAGDDFRHIDWGVYGRTDRLYVREFREERDLNIVVLIDTSGSMAFPEGEGKFDFARRLGLALGYVGLADGDSVMFGLLGKKVTPRYSGARALSRAWREVEQCEAGGSYSFMSEARAALSRVKLPGKCFLVSDYLAPHEDIFPALDFIRSRNFDLSLIQVLAPSEISLPSDTEATVLVDAETGAEIEMPLDRQTQIEYSRSLARHIRALEDYAARAGIVHTLVSSGDNLSDFVLTRLPELKLLQ